MSQYIPNALRKLVAERAGHRCEYCLVHEDDMLFTYQVEHIVSLKHGGESESKNLAYACSSCNEKKGTDLGTYLPGSSRLIRLFHPRKDNWRNHFSIGDGEIVPKTRIGAATVKVLDLNNPDRIILRQLLMKAGRY